MYYYVLLKKFMSFFYTFLFGFVLILECYGQDKSDSKMAPPRHVIHLNIDTSNWEQIGEEFICKLTKEIKKYSNKKESYFSFTFSPTTGKGMTDYEFQSLLHNLEDQGILNKTIEMNFNGNSIKDYGISFIGSYMPFMPNLDRLHLERNDLTPAGLKMLQEHLKENGQELSYLVRSSDNESPHRLTAKNLLLNERLLSPSAQQCLCQR